MLHLFMTVKVLEWNAEIFLSWHCVNGGLVYFSNLLLAELNQASGFLNLIFSLCFHICLCGPLV